MHATFTRVGYSNEFKFSAALLGSMQGMFGASVSELYLLNKLLINIGSNCPGI